MKAIYATDPQYFSKIIKLRLLFRIMTNMAQSLDFSQDSFPRAESICCANKLSQRYACITSILKFIFINEKESSANNIAELLYVISHNFLCHCLFVSLINFLADLCENSPTYITALNSRNGLSLIMFIASNYSVATQLCCAKLVTVILRGANKYKLQLSYVKSKELSRSFGLWFSKISKREKKGDPSNAKEKAKRRCSAALVKATVKPVEISKERRRSGSSESQKIPRKMSKEERKEISERLLGHSKWESTKSIRHKLSEQEETKSGQPLRAAVSSIDIPQSAKQFYLFLLTALFDIKYSQQGLDRILQETSSGISPSSSLTAILAVFYKSAEEIKYKIEYPEALIVILKMIKTLDLVPLYRMFLMHLETMLTISPENMIVVVSNEGIVSSLISHLKIADLKAGVKDYRELLVVITRILSQILFHAIITMTADNIMLGSSLRQIIKAYLAFSSSLSKTHEAANAILLMWRGILESVNSQLEKQGDSLAQNISLLTDTTMKLFTIATMRNELGFSMPLLINRKMKAASASVSSVRDKRSSMIILEHSQLSESHPMIDKQDIEKTPGQKQRMVGGDENGGSPSPHKELQHQDILREIASLNLSLFEHFYNPVMRQLNKGGSYITLDSLKGILAKPKESPLGAHLKLWFLDQGIKNGPAQMQVIPQFMNIVQILKLLEKNNMLMDSILRCLQYFFIIMEFAKSQADYKNKFMKKLHNTISSLTALLVYYVPGSFEIVSEASAIKTTLASLLKFIATASLLSHSATLEYYKSSFVSAFTAKLVWPPEKLKVFANEGPESLINAAQAITGNSLKNACEDIIALKKSAEEHLAHVSGLVESVTKERIMYLASKSPENEGSKITFFKNLDQIKSRLNNSYSLLYMKEEENIIIQKVIACEKQSHSVKVMQKRLKGWRGSWRDKKTLDLNLPHTLPLKLSSHRFANSNRCLLKIRSSQDGKLVQKPEIKLSNYELLGSRELLCDSFLYCSLVFKQSNSADSPSAVSLLGIDIKHDTETKIIANFAKLVSEYYHLLFMESQLHRELGFPPPLDCEIYTGFFAIKGRIFLKVTGAPAVKTKPHGRHGIISKSYIIFVISKLSGSDTKIPNSSPPGAEERVEDDRMMFEHYPRLREKSIHKLNLQYLKMVYKKTMVEANTALELEFTTGKSILFNFPFEETREKFCQSLQKLKDLQGCPQLKYDPTLTPIKLLEKTKLTDNWINGKISTFDYLLFLNNLASRSFHNFSQYPVFPWVVANYASTPTIQWDDKSSYRDLTKNLGLQGDQRRAEEAKERYTQPDYFGHGNYHFGSHYSNPGIIYQFMMRIYPFFEAYIKFFNGLDDPNRMFHSIKESYASALKDSADLRELIPEFYSLPEMFTNRENLKFGQREDDNAKVSDIILPAYSKNSAILFVNIMREALESETASGSISKWIDLIFGFQQRGKEAEKALNIYAPLCMDPGRVLQMSEAKERNAYRKQAFHWGQTPQQIILKKHSERIPKVTDRAYNIFDRNAKLKAFFGGSTSTSIETATTTVSSGAPTPNFTASIANNLGASVVETDAKPALKTRQEYQGNYSKMTAKIIIKTESGVDYFYHIGFNGIVLEGIIGELGGPNPSYLAEMSSKSYKPGYISDTGWLMYDVSLVYNFPILSYKKGNADFIIQAGYTAGQLNAFPVAKMEKCKTLPICQSLITRIEFTKDAKLVIIGTKAGECLIYETATDHDWVLRSYLQDHGDELTWIHINEEMQMFATASEDGFAHVYKLSFAPKLWRSFRQKIGCGVQYTFLAMNPIPVIILFSRDDSSISLYHLNGTLLKEIKEKIRYMLDPIIGYDSKFNNYLAYYRERDYQWISLKLPELEKKRAAKKKLVSTWGISESQKAIIGGDDEGGLFVVRDPSCASVEPGKIIQIA